MDLRRLTVWLAALALSAGCGGGGGGGGGGETPADTGSATPDVAAGDTAGPSCPTGAAGEVLFSFAAEGEIYSTPAVGADGTVYFATRDFKIYAVDCRGQQKWVFSYDCEPDGAVACPHAFVSSPALGKDGRIYIGDDTVGPNYLFALDPAGALAWSFTSWTRTGQMDASPALGTDGSLYLGAGGFGADGFAGQLLGFAPDGAFLSGFPLDTGAVDGSPVVVGTTVYAGHSRSPRGQREPLHHVVLAAGADGSAVWETTLADMDGFPQSRAKLSSLAVDGAGRLLLVVTRRHAEPEQMEADLVRLDPATGVEQASVRLGGQGCWGPCAPLVRQTDAGEEVFVVVGEGALDRVSGASWQAQPFGFGVLELPRSGAERWPTPVLADDGHVYALGVSSELMSGGAANAIYELDDAGQQVAELPFGGTTDVVTSSLQMGPGGVVYVGTRDGKLHAIATGAGGLDRASPWPALRHDESNSGNPGW